MSPVKPPIVKTKIKPTANSMGVSKLSAPRHIVAIQLKTLTPVGTEISIVAYIKNNSLDTGMPVANIWCAQTINDRIAIAATAYTIEIKKKRGVRKRRYYVRNDSERRQNHDIHLRMPEKPENMLIQHRVPAARRVEKGSAEMAVEQQHRHRARQHRYHRQQQIGGHQPGPCEHRHFHQAHPRRAHIQNGHHNIDRAHNR